MSLSLDVQLHADRKGLEQVCKPVIAAFDDGYPVSILTLIARVKDDLAALPVRVRLRTEARDYHG